LVDLYAKNIQFDWIQIEYKALLEIDCMYIDFATWKINILVECGATFVMRQVSVRNIDNMIVT
jgi:hypothetical protein